MNNAAGDVPIPAVDPQPGHEDGAAVGMKLLVDLDEAGRPYGDNYAKLATLVGKLVRAQVPLNYTDWRIVPQIFKDSIWDGLMLKFTFAVPSSLVRPTVEGSYSQKFRTFKYRLRKSLKGKVTAEDILSVKPPGCHLPFWEAFVENESKPESSAKRAKYKENCEKNTVRHTLGRLSYAQKMYNLQLNDEDFIAGRPEIWMEGHKGKNGVIHPSAVEKFEQVKIANEKRKSLAKDGDLSAMDFENDAITDVFGPDKGKGCFRAFSSQLSKSQAITARLAKTVNASKASSSAGPNENSVLVDRINKLSKAFDDFVAIQQLNQLQSNSVPSVDASSPTKVGSTSIPVDAMGNQESNNGRTQYVNLLNKKKKIAATGYIMQGKEGRVFHGQPLAADERRVQIEAILDETCAVYDAPQGDDYFTLKDLLGITGWLVWPLKRLEFLDE